MFQRNTTHQSCIKTLEKLSLISAQVYEYYFSKDERQNVTRKPFYRLKRSVMDLYTFVYEHCTSKPNYQEKMMELFKTALQQHLLKHMPILNQSIGHSNLIRTFNLIWDSYMSYMFLLCKRIFSYLNRYYVPANQYQSLQKIGMKVFTGVFFTENTSKAFIGAYCEDLSEMRKQRIIQDNQLYYFSESLAMIGSDKYFPLLKEIYFGESEKFYQKIYQQNSDIEPINYLNLVNNLNYFERLLQEKAICLIPKETEQLFTLFNSKLVSQFTDKLLRHPYGFRYFLKNHKTNQLSIVHKVFNHIEGFQKLRNQLYEFLIEEGSVKFNEKSKIQSPQIFIHSFYDFYIAYSKLIAEGFNRSQEMQVTLKNGFEKLISKFEKMIELLYQFTRVSLDQGRFETEKQIIITIFQQFSYKDEFLSLYRSSLQKKIINGGLVYMIEKKFIQTMNQICGSQSTSQLDKLLEDYIESMPNDIIPQQLKSLNFNVKIMALHYWEKKFENQVTMNLTLVPSLKSTWEKFENIYSEKFAKRKLLLLPYQTTVILDFNLNRTGIKIKCNLIQACVLLFSTTSAQKKIKQQDLISNLTVEKSFLNEAIQSLSSLILQTQPGVYQFDQNYKNSSEVLIDLSIRLQLQKKITKNIQQDREILIQAAIVKIVKRRKEVMFEELAIEVTQKIKLFKPHPASIKQAIEKLVKKDVVQEINVGIIRYIE